LTGLLAPALVVLAALYLLGLGATALLAPTHATRFLSGFAGSARVHYLELSIRLVVGISLVSHAPEMLLPGLFSAFGWALVITTAGLLAIPWRWHQRFAHRAVPQATRHLWLVALGSFALGVLLLTAVWSPGR
jgi:hypothetical protein